MERHARTIVVSIFVLLTLAGLIGFKSWITAPGASAQTMMHRIVVRGPVSGLSVGSEVRYLGVSVGRVSAITLSATEPGQVDVDFTTEQPLNPSDLVAQLEAQGITGLSVIELRLRSQQNPGFATDPGLIPGYPSLVTQLSGPASSIANSAEEVAAKINDLLSAEKLKHLGESIEQLNHTTTNLAAASDDLSSMVISVRNASNELETTFKTYRQVGLKLESDVLPTVQQIAVELKSTVTSANSILNENSEEINRLFEHDIPNIVGMTDELARSLQGINELANGLDNNPSRLIYGERLPELEIDHEQ